MRHKNIVLVGTSHIARQSLKEVKEAIEKENPDIVALELDESRLHGLMQKKRERIRLRDIRRIGVKGYLFSLLGAWAERKLGEKTGVKPGTEMLTAYKLARKNEKTVCFIDQDISITLRRLSNTITWKEKWHFIVDIFKAVILRKKEIEFDLSTVPSGKIIKKLTSKVKKRYPNIYNVLVEERNEYMADRLAELSSKNTDKKIVAIIGAGHEKEIIEMVKEKLKTQVTYSFNIQVI
jgi:pheromone shutdown-related protein TraB